MTAITVTGISVGLAGVIAGPARAAGVKTAATRPAATNYSVAGRLNGVAAAADNNAWAVGYTGTPGSPKILILRWNGSAWSSVPSRQLKLAGATGALSAITVVNARDVYAVGYTGSPLGTTHTLLLHWNGSTWSAVTSPAPVSGGALMGVTATATSGWAVGYYATGQAAIDYRTVIFRLSGSAWTRMGTTNLGSDVALSGVATTSATTTWAVGDEVGQITGVVARWNGRGWAWDTSVPYRKTYEAIGAIAAGPGGTAFTVGSNGNSPSTPPLSMKWTGNTWEKVAVSAPASAILNAVAFAPGGAAWAAGALATYPGHTLVVRWNGHAWTRVASPAGEGLNGIGFSAASYGWAVGDVLTSSGVFRTLITHWNGHTWS
jgi:hypothetical protein